MLRENTSTLISKYIALQIHKENGKNKITNTVTTSRFSPAEVFLMFLPLPIYSTIFNIRCNSSCGVSTDFTVLANDTQLVLYARELLRRQLRTTLRNFMSVELFHLIKASTPMIVIVSVG